jgi:PiT family inorganic phosphate transporter
MSVPAATAEYDWILAITTIAFVFAAAGNGANDVANSYATSVGAKTLTMAQASVLATVTEFIGAVALGARVTSTIKNGIITIDRFDGRPGVLMLAMGCAEVGNAFWLITATSLGMPVSTTHTIVGSLVGVGFAAQSAVTWGWEDGSLSQVAASWIIAPGIAAAFAAITFASIKYSVLERKESFEWAMRLIPLYMASTGAILALFLAIEVPTSTVTGGGPLAGTVMGTFAGCLLLAYGFFLPFFKRKLVMEDRTVRIRHIFYGPLLLRDDVKLVWPGDADDEFLANPSEDSYSAESTTNITDEENMHCDTAALPIARDAHTNTIVPPHNPSHANKAINENETTMVGRVKQPEPEERWLDPVKDLSWTNPRKFWNWLKYLTLQGVARDCIHHDSASLRAIHAKARHYDLRVEHMFTYCQIVSAIMMSISHGSNDVANAVGPWAAVYQTYQSGAVDTESPTPVWFLVTAGLLLGLGFAVYGHRIVKTLGRKITQMSPTRGFSIEMGAAITVLLASKLGLPVSTTHCLVGASLGVALMNYDLGAVNWKQLAIIFMGWVITLPAAGLMSGLLCVMALNAPSF